MTGYTPAQLFRLTRLTHGLSKDPALDIPRKDARQLCIDTENRLNDLLSKDFTSTEITTLTFCIGDITHQSHVYTINTVRNALAHVLDDRLATARTFLSVSFIALQIIYLIENAKVKSNHPP